MASHNNFSCRLNPVVLEALRARWRGFDGGRTMSEIISDLLDAAMTTEELGRAERHLRKKKSESHGARRHPNIEWPNYDDMAIGE
jgi:hypothetical protein